jgi:hypothetical protein
VGDEGKPLPMEVSFIISVKIKMEDRKKVTFFEISPFHHKPAVNFNNMAKKSKCILFSALFVNNGKIAVYTISILQIRIASCISLF